MKDRGPGKKAGDEGRGTRDKDCIIAPNTVKVTQEDYAVHIKENIPSVYPSRIQVMCEWSIMA